MVLTYLELLRDFYGFLKDALFSPIDYRDPGTGKAISSCDSEACFAMKPC